ncbi:MAG: saccharopine dehydrogenase, partial [Ignavibacteriaceae bacterium]
QFDEETKTTSMARTTGYTCTSVARLLLDGGLNKKGIFPPEYIGAIPGYFDKIVSMLKKKKIRISSSEKRIPMV